MKYFLKTYLIFFLASLFFLFTQSAQAETVTLNYDNLIDYSIISDNAIVWAEFGKIVQDEEYELKDKRLPNARFYSDNKIKIYSSNIFVKDILTDEWFEVEFATTTEDLFYNELEKQIPVENLFEKLISFYEFKEVHALSSGVYSNSSDGRIERDDNGTTWSAVRDAATGESVGTVNTSYHCAVYKDTGSNRYIFDRCLVSFDTSVITADYCVSSSTFYGYSLALNSDGDANDYYVLTEFQPADPASYAIGDYNACGYTELSGHRANGFTSAFSLNLNQSGLDLINKTGYTSYCYREGHDLNDDEIDTNITEIGQGLFFSEYAGTDRDPYLLIEYDTCEEPEEPIATTTIEHEFYDIDNLDIYDISIITSKSEAYTNASGTLITFTYFYSPLIQYLLIFSIACLSLYTVSIFYQIRRSTKKWG